MNTTQARQVAAGIGGSLTIRTQEQTGPQHAGGRFAFTSEEFLPERVELLYKLSGGDTPMILFVGAFAAFALWGLVQTPLLLAWGVWLCVSSILRYGLSRLYMRRMPPPEDAAKWENIFCMASGIIGGAWGGSILLLSPDQPSMHVLVVTFLLSSISMGLPPSLAPSPKAFASFAMPIIVPIIALLFTTGGDINLAAALLLLVLSGVLISIYISANRTLIATLAYGRENARLLERVSAAVDSAALAVWEWESVSGSITLDAAWASLLRQPPRAVSISIEEMQTLVHPEDVAGFHKAWGECVAGIRPDFSVEFRARRADGDWIWFHARGRASARLPDGEAMRIVGTNIDVTKRKAAETELYTALQREKELSEMKSKFVSIASHELRTPLTTILSSAELLEHYSESLSAEERLGMLRSIQEAVHRMTAMINDVLIIGKSGSGRLKFNPTSIDLREFTQQLVDSMRRSEARKHEILLDCRLDHDMRLADEQLLRHILTNLLSNAVKYSPAGSTVSVKVADRGVEVTIEVSDQGIGIPEKDQPKLFESFHRASNVGDRPGTGLGLAIVKTAAELHQGGIALASRPGEGTRFTVTLQAELA